MPILADTNIWVRHFRSANPRLTQLLEDNEILCHPVVIGELSMANLRSRKTLLGSLNRLERPSTASQKETHHLVERNMLYGCGLQWNDALLLASCILSGVHLWTHDRALARAAQRFGVSFDHC